MSARRTERLLELFASFAAARRPVPFAEVCGWFPDQYGSTRSASARRRLERDLADLAELGVPIRLDAGDGAPGYVLDREAAFLPELSLSADEWAAVYLAASAVAGTGPSALALELEPALAKIALRASASDTVDLRALERRVVIHTPRGERDAALDDTLDALQAALAGEQRVAIRYHTPGAAAPEVRTVHPYALVCRRGRWLLAGYTEERDAIRVYAIRRIRELTPLGPPHVIVPADFDHRAHTEVPEWRYERHAPVAVELSIDPEYAWLVARTLGLAPDAPELRGERAHLALEVTHAPALLDAVRAHAGRVLIERPAALAAELEAQVALMLATYEGDAARTPESGRELRGDSSALDTRVELHPAARAGDLEDRSPQGRAAATAARSPAGDARPHLEAPVSSTRSSARARDVLLLLAYLRRHPGAPVREAAVHLGVPPREVRALARLSTLCGRQPFAPDDLVDVTIDAKDRLHLHADHALGTPVGLTRGEAVAITVALHALHTDDGPFSGAARSALAEIRRGLTAPAARASATLGARISVDAARSDPTLALLTAAWRAQHEVELAYYTASRDEMTERTLRTYALIRHLGVWYAAGRDSLRNAVRVFRVDRIARARDTGVPYTIPASFDPRRYEHDETFTGRERAVLQARGALAERLRETLPPEHVRDGPDGTVLAELAFTQIERAAIDALGLGEEAEVLSPPEVRAETRRRLLKLQAALSHTRSELADGSVHRTLSTPQPP